jgi:hypothetical protein
LLWVVNASINEGAAVLDEVLNQDTPSNGLATISAFIIRVSKGYLPIVVTTRHDLESP